MEWWSDGSALIRRRPSYPRCTERFHQESSASPLQRQGSRNLQTEGTLEGFITARAPAFERAVTIETVMYRNEFMSIIQSESGASQHCDDTNRIRPPWPWWSPPGPDCPDPNPSWSETRPEADGETRRGQDRRANTHTHTLIRSPAALWGTRPSQTAYLLRTDLVVQFEDVEHAVSDRLQCERRKVTIPSPLRPSQSLTRKTHSENMIHN